MEHILLQHTNSGQPKRWWITFYYSTPPVENPRDGAALTATAHQRWTTPEMVEHILLQHTNSGQPQRWCSTYYYKHTSGGQPQRWWSTSYYSTSTVDNPRDGGFILPQHSIGGQPHGWWTISYYSTPAVRNNPVEESTSVCESVPPT